METNIYCPKITGMTPASCLLSQSLFQSHQLPVSMPRWLMRWILNPGLPRSKPLGGYKVDSAFHPSKVDSMSTRNFWELSVKSKLPPRSGSVALRPLNPIYRKGPKNFFFP